VTALNAGVKRISSSARASPNLNPIGLNLRCGTVPAEALFQAIDVSWRRRRPCPRRHKPRQGRVVPRAPGGTSAATPGWH